MFRTLAQLLFCSASLASLAQRPGGPITIAASAHPRGAHVMPASTRGGAPYNDLCENAVLNFLPQGGSITITGDNTGSTDTETFGNPVSWEAFSVDTCTTVTLSYCGTDPLFELVYSILIVGCPDFLANVPNSGITYCDDGNTIISYENLPAGTYYVPVLRISGAEGPYVITISSDVCDTPPLNDICTNAALLQVVDDCSLGTVLGNNANAVINSAPPCATTSSQFQDVWYQFDSGADTTVIITLDPGNIGDIGIEVRASCAGPSVFCAIGDTIWTVAVDPGTNYRVRIFSNNDLGFGGTFGICITRPSGVCDAGAVQVTGGGTAITACVNGDGPISFEQINATGGELALVLTDAADTIVSLITGGALDPGVLLPGEYHVWGFVHDGQLFGVAAGQPLDNISSTGACLDPSDEPVVVTIEICQALTEADGTVPEFTVLSASDGPCILWNGPRGRIGWEVFDDRGALLGRRTGMVQPGQVMPILPPGAAAAGLYTVRLTSVGGASSVRRLFVR